MADYYKSDFVQDMINTVVIWKAENNPELAKNWYLVSFALLDDKLPILTVFYMVNETVDNFGLKMKNVSSFDINVFEPDSLDFEASMRQHRCSTS